MFNNQNTFLKQTKGTNKTLCHKQEKLLYPTYRSFYKLIKAKPIKSLASIYNRILVLFTENEREQLILTSSFPLYSCESHFS